MTGIEMGIYSFGDATPDPATGRTIDVGQRVRDLVDEIVLADEVGLDVFGVGEHHRPDFPVSSPAVVLAAAAARTSRIRLTSSVTSTIPASIAPRIDARSANSNTRPSERRMYHFLEFIGRLPRLPDTDLTSF